MSQRPLRTRHSGRGAGPSTHGAQREDGRANNPDGHQLPTGGRKVGRPRKTPVPPISRLDTTETTDTSETMETTSSSSSSHLIPEPMPVSNPISIIPTPTFDTSPSTSHRMPYPDFVAKQPSINMTKMFSGQEDEDLEHWIEGFLAQTYRVTDETYKLVVMKSLLDGRAKNMIRKLALGRIDTCEKVIAELRSVFGNLRVKEPKSELDKIKKDPKETYHYYGIRVAELVRNVYEKIDEDSASLLNIEYFIRGLPTDLGILVKARNPVSLEKAIKYAKQYENERTLKLKPVKEQKDKDKLLINLETSNPGAASMPSGSLLELADKWDKATSDIKDQIKQLNAKIGKLEPQENPNASVTNKSQNDIRRSSPRRNDKRKLNSNEYYQNKRRSNNKRCYLCNQLGHIQYKHQREHLNYGQ